MRSGAVSVLVIVMATLAGVCPVEAAQDDLVLASRGAGSGPGADGNALSSTTALSADGRFVAFHTDADNLDPESNDAVTDVFVRDLVAGETTLVSRASGPSGVVGDGRSWEPSISADGRYVAFSSLATNLDPESNDAVEDVFVRDLVANTTTLVSRASGGTGVAGDGHSFEGEIAADGRHVAFSSQAGNLDAESSDLETDVFVRDLFAQTTTLVSRASTIGGVPGAPVNDFAHWPAISADGTRIAFHSNARNLDPPTNDAVIDVYVRDVEAETTTLVSRASGQNGALADWHSSYPQISADGRVVSFASDADNLDAESNDAVQDVFVRDLVDQTTTLVTRATGPTGVPSDGYSIAAPISSDGRFVAFESQANNLDAESNDAVQDVFVRDLVDQTTTLVSRASGPTGPVADGWSFTPAISADGRYVSFGSQGTNLDTESNDAVTDVFVRDVLGPQTSPSFSVADRTAKEGKKGARPFTFTVTLSGLPGRTVTVDFSTRDGSARAAGDYAATNGTLTFAPNETTKQITVDVTGDKRRERKESFTVELFNANGAAVGDGVGRGLIKNDDRR